MKKLLVTLAGATLATAAMSASAEDIGAGFDLSANVGVVSDYLFRGISQTNNHGAIQGGIDLKHSSGVYVGTWMSSLNTGFADHEEDLYIGYGYSITSDIALDAHYIKFVYPGSPVATNPTFAETHFGVTAYGAALNVDYSDDLPTFGNTIHYSAGYGYTLPGDVSLSAMLGHYDLKHTDTGGRSFGNKSNYNYWNVGVSKKLVGVTWAVSYNDTNLSPYDCRSFASAIGGNSSSCGREVILAATKSF